VKQRHTPLNAAIWIGTCLICQAPFSSGAETPVSGKPLSSSENSQAEPPTDQTFSADRPGFTLSTPVLPIGIWQLEGGYRFDRSSENGLNQRNVALGAPQLRLGLGHRWEVRLGGDGFRVWQQAGNNHNDRASGFSDLAMGAKFSVFEEGKIVPALSLIPQVSLPVGAGAFSSAGYDPSLKLAWSKSLPAGFSAGGNFGFASITDSRGRYGQQAYSVVLAHPVVRNLAVYAEVYDIREVARGNTSCWTGNAGFSQMIRNSMQLDVQVGRTLSPSMPAWFVATGVALRGTRALGRSR
jgi:hypothetical protein